MFRLLFRFIGLCLLASALVAFIVDATRSAVNGTLYVTPLSESVMALLQGKFISVQDFIVQHVHPVIWDLVMVHLLKVPVWLILGFIGVLAIRLGSSPAPKFGFSSR